MELTDEILKMEFSVFFNLHDCEGCPVKDDCTGHPDRYVPCRDEEFETVGELMDITGTSVQTKEDHINEIYEEEERIKLNAETKKKKADATRFTNYSINKKITKKRREIRSLKRHLSKRNSLRNAFSITNNIINRTNDKITPDLYEIKINKEIKSLEIELENIIQIRKIDNKKRNNPTS